MTNYSDIHCALVFDAECDMNDIEELLVPLADRCRSIITAKKEVELDACAEWKRHHGFDIDYYTALKVCNVAWRRERGIERRHVLAVILGLVQSALIFNDKTHLWICAPKVYEDWHWDTLIMTAKYLFAHSTMPFFQIQSSSYDGEVASSQEMFGFRTNEGIEVFWSEDVARKLSACLAAGAN